MCVFMLVTKVSPYVIFNYGRTFLKSGKLTCVRDMLTTHFGKGML